MLKRILTLLMAIGLCFLAVPISHLPAPTGKELIQIGYWGEYFSDDSSITYARISEKGTLLTITVPRK